MLIVAIVGDGMTKVCYACTRVLPTEFPDMRRCRVCRRFACDHTIPCEDIQMDSPPSTLSFATLRGANQARLPQYKTKHGDTVHSIADGSDWTPAQWFQALVGEVGEYANFRKKFERGDISEEEFMVRARKELADVATYLDLLAARLGIDLGQAVTDKFNEVSGRVGSNVRIFGDSWSYITTGV